jgi:glycosyltransferase involved in cell wall biosynthesis
MKFPSQNQGHQSFLRHMQPAIIIPVYNHGSQVADVIGKSKSLALPLFVVDDGSNDSTAQVLRAIEGITILHHPKNLGKGAAILTGFAAALENNCDWAITLDGDGQHNPEDIRQLLSVVNEDERCIVIGSRENMSNNKNVPWTSKFGRKFSNFWVWVSGGPLVTDSQCGFRMYPIPEALHLDTKARRYQFEVEILVKAQRSGIKTKEAPVGVIYQERGIRVSHFRPWRDFFRNSATFSRLILARICKGFGL